MIEEKVNGLKIKVYDSIDELPIKRFHKYNKFLLVDSGVGSDMNDINNHVSKISSYINTEDKKNALVELENMRQLLYMITEELSPKYLAFACLVHSINGVLITDLSDDGIKNVLKRLNNVNKKWFDKILESLKKKIDQELGLYFKQTFEDSKTKEYYGILKKRVLIQLEGIKTGEQKIDELEEIENSLITFFKPQNFGGGSIEVDYDKNFESMCLMISKNTGLNAKDMNVLEFYNSFEQLREQAKDNLKQQRNGK